MWGNGGRDRASATYSPLNSLHAPGKKLRDFNAALDAEEHPEITALGSEVAEWARGFPTIGFSADEMRYPE